MITYYTGPMCSGKSTALYNKFKTLDNAILYCFTTLKNKKEYRTHDNTVVPCTFISSFKDIDLSYKNICIDEIQFSDYTIVNSYSNQYIYLAGLNYDWKKQPFKPVYADVTFLMTAKCSGCGGTAIYTKKIGGNSSIIDEGGKYEPVCKKCY